MHIVLIIIGIILAFIILKILGAILDTTLVLVLLSAAICVGAYMWFDSQDSFFVEESIDTDSNSGPDIKKVSVFIMKEIPKSSSNSGGKHLLVPNKPVEIKLYKDLGPRLPANYIVGIRKYTESGSELFIESLETLCSWVFEPITNNSATNEIKSNEDCIISVAQGGIAVTSPDGEKWF